MADRGDATQSVPIAAVTDVRKNYPGRRGESPTVALDGVDLVVQAGAAVAVVGRSAAGKSTLARLMVGLESPTSGSVSIGGSVVPATPSLAQRRRLARLVQPVFQNPTASLDPHQVVASALDEVVRLHAKLDRAARAVRVADLLDRVGLDPSVGVARPDRLSGGQCQRVALARALACQPRLLVLDEAVASLDVSSQAQILNLLTDIRRATGVALLFITHDLSVVRQISDEIVVMDRGRVVEAGATTQVLDRPQHPVTAALLSAVPRPPAATDG